MPWHGVNFGSYGLALLKAIAAERQHLARVEYANLTFAAMIGQRLYERLQNSRHAAELVFVPAAFGLAGAALDRWLEAAVRVVKHETGIDTAEFRRLALDAAPEFIDGLTSSREWRSCDAIGFALVYSQTIPAIALARSVKRVTPEMPIVIGGAGAFGTPGARLVEHFECFDVAVLGEAESSINPLLEALGAPERLSQVRGIAYRDAEAGPVRSTPPPPRTVLDELPIADFDDYFEQRRRFQFDGELWCSFESSRGCWWGEYQVCTFCGLNGEAVAYRRKSPARVADEIRTLASRYGVRSFSATDNILPRDALTSLLPLLRPLARDLPDLRIFYQLKSNITREHAAMLREAGITMVQPGIESFNDHILSLMRKGATALTQIACLKYLTEQGLEVIYGILTGTVGETAEDYREQEALIPAVSHLVPPSYFTPIHLDRFSPYEQQPAAYGLSQLRATAATALLYPVSIDHLGIARSFEATIVPAASADDRERLTVAVQDLGAAVERWQRDYVKDLLTYSVTDRGRVFVRDERRSDATTMEVTGLERDIFLRCEVACRRAEVARALSGVPAEEMIGTVDRLVARGWLLEHRGMLFTLPVRRPAQRLLGLTGKPCSGKTTTAALLHAHGVRIFDVGAAIAATLGADAYALSPTEKLQRFGRGESVFHAIADALASDLAEHGLVAIDSLKAASDARVLRELFPAATLTVIHVVADERQRASRFSARGRADDGPDLGAKDRSVERVGLQRVAAEADLVLRNDKDSGGLARAVAQLRAALAHEGRYWWRSLSANAVEPDRNEDMTRHDGERERRRIPTQ